MSTVIENIKIEAPKHPNFKRSIPWKNETGFRYLFHNRDDINREFILSVMVFNVPGDVSEGQLIE